jgi:hypothetical protein
MIRTPKGFNNNNHGLEPVGIKNKEDVGFGGIFAHLP